jgi:predicted Zn-dependent protease
MKFKNTAVLMIVCMFTLTSFGQAPDNTQTPASTQGNTQDQTAQTNDSAQAADTATPTQPATDSNGGTQAAQKKNAKCSKQNVDCIGENRGIGNRGLGDWYALDTDIKMGKQYAMMVESSARMVQDPVITEYVNRIGQNIVRNSDAKVPFTIKVIDSDDVNAFALPGGFFYVNSGLILAADDEAELAGVMAHEIAHVAARHAMKEQTRANAMQLATIPLIFVTHSWGLYEAENLALSLTMPVVFMKFSRGFESEADYLGLQYMYKAGYDPQSFIAFFEKIRALEKQKPGTISKVFASHPMTDDRITKAQDEIRQILPPRPEYMVTTSEFDLVKARLAAFENSKKAVDARDNTNKPTLRKTAGDANNCKQGGDSKDCSGNSGDDRPTLQRRDED